MMVEMNEMLKRIVEILGKDAPWQVKYNGVAVWRVEHSTGMLNERFGSSEAAEDRCEQLNKEWIAREIVKCMRDTGPSIAIINQRLWKYWIDDILRKS